MASDDTDLWHRLRRGDREAWERFFRATWRPAVRYATARVSGDRGLAEDVVGESLLVLLRDLEQFDPLQGSLGGFLFGILRHRVRSQRRRQQRTNHVEADSSIVAAQDLASDDGECVMQALMDLTVAEREMLLRHHDQRVGTADLAREAGIGIEAMQSRLKRAREHLAERLRARNHG